MNLKLPIAVLYIEDDIDVARLMQIRIDSHMFKLDLAKNGQEGKEKIRHAHYDVVIIDYYLPDADCKGLIQDIKSHSPNIAIIVLTGCKPETVCEEVLSAGANACFEKDIRGDFIQQLPLVIQKIMFKEPLRF